MKKNVLALSIAAMLRKLPCVYWDEVPMYMKGNNGHWVPLYDGNSGACLWALQNEFIYSVVWATQFVYRNELIVNDWIVQ